MADIPKAKGYDQSFKLLSDRDPVGFLGLVGAVRLDEPVEIEKIERELITAARAVDQLYRVKDSRGSRLVHIEANTRWRENVPVRVTDYGVRIWLSEQEPVDSYVLILIPDPPPPLVPPAGLIQSGDMVIHKGYHLILLWELDAREWLECGRPNILPFVPLMRGGEAELRASVQAIVALPDEGQRKELGAYLSIVSGLRYDRDDIHQILGEALMSIELEDLESSSIYQYIVEKTEARGRKKWRAEGRAETVMEILRRAVARRFPGFELGFEVERITNLEALEDLCLTIHEISDAATLKARLAALLPQTEKLNGVQS